MLHIRKSDVAEYAAMLLLVALAAWVWFGWSPDHQHKRQSVPLLQPWQQDSEIAPGWFLVGIGQIQGDNMALVVQLRSPDHKQPAFVRLTAKDGKRCKRACTKNFRLSLDFRQATPDGELKPVQLKDAPPALQKAFQETAYRLSLNDTAQSAQAVLQAEWDDIGPPPTEQQAGTDVRSWPTPPTYLTILILLALWVGLWFLLRLLRHPSRWWELALVVGLTTIAAWLRWPLLDMPFLSDGPIQRMAYANAPLIDVLLMRTAELHHPPLTLLLIRMTMMLGGAAADVVRLPFFTASILLPAALYLVGQRLFGRAAGLVAALLAVLHPALIDQAKDLNDFGILALFGALSVYLYLRLIASPLSSWRWVFAITALLTIHSNLLGLVLVGGIVLWDLARRPAKIGRALRLDALIVIFAGSLPIFGMLAKALLALGEQSGGPARIPGLDWGTEPGGALLTDIVSRLLLPPYGVSLAILAVVGVGLIARRPMVRQRAAVIIWLLLLMTAALTSLAIVDRIRADYTVILLIFLFPLAAIIVAHLAYGASSDPGEVLRRLAASALGVLLLAGPLLVTAASPQAPDNANDSLSRIRLALQSDGSEKTVAVLARMGPLVNYHLCGKAMIWEDRDAEGPHTCRPSMSLYSLGRMDSWIDEDMLAMDRRLSQAMNGKPFYLLFGKQTPNGLSAWSKIRCKRVVTEPDLALFHCPALSKID